MNAIVDVDLCIGCGLCTETCPDVFEMIVDVAIVTKKTVPSDSEESCRDTKDHCPVNAIAIQD